MLYAAGEAANPTVQIPRAAKRVIYRIMFFCGHLHTCLVNIDTPRYHGCPTRRHDVSHNAHRILTASSVPYNDDRLVAGTGNAASSPFVIAMENAG